jgi:hypothetical protein
MSVNVMAVAPPDPEPLPLPLDPEPPPLPLLPPALLEVPPSVRARIELVWEPESSEPQATPVRHMAPERTAEMRAEADLVWAMESICSRGQLQ